MRFFVIFLILGIFFTVEPTSSIASSYTAYNCIKKKDDGKWPFYYSIYRNYSITRPGKCPLGFVSVSDKKYKEFKNKIDKKYTSQKNPNNVYRSPSDGITKTASNETSDWRKNLSLESNNKDSRPSLKSTSFCKLRNNQDSYVWSGPKPVFISQKGCGNHDKIDQSTYTNLLVYWSKKHALAIGGKSAFTSLAKSLKKDYEKYNLDTDYLEKKILDEFPYKNSVKIALKNQPIINTENKVEVAKVETSKTQKVAEMPKLENDEVYYNLNFCTHSYIKNPLNEIKSVNDSKDFLLYVGTCPKNKPKEIDTDIALELIGNRNICIKHRPHPDNPIFNDPLYMINDRECNPEWNEYAMNYNGYEFYTKANIKLKSQKTLSKIVQNQKTTNQEEFKPENKDVDNQAPIIEVAKNLKFESQTFKFKGRIKDKNKFYLTANGRPVKTDRKGRFEIEGFVIDPEQGEQLQLVAIDQWNNRSEQTVNIEVEFKQVVDARSYEKPNPNKVRVRNNDNKVGIIIGIEKYQTLNNVDAPYANRDANAFRAYANRALGIPNQNLKVLIDNKATRAELLKSLKIWLPQVTRGQQKDVYIFFAGHGLASDDGKDLHILPQDGDPILLEDTAISRVEMFELINKVNPNSVTMFFDTCYSGQTRSEQMLVAGLRPVRIVANDQEIPNNYTIFTASDNDETSGSIEQAEHGIFSYYLMKGLEGNADLNKDKTLTNGELIAYLKNNVSQEAFSQNRQQEPMLSGNPDNILIRY
jgi:hypothetical protein